MLGTKGNPFVVSSGSDFIRLEQVLPDDLPLGEYFYVKQVGNISVSEGISADNVSYDGQGYKISGLRTPAFIELWGSEIKRINIVGSVLESEDWWDVLGPVCGMAEKTKISLCSVDNTTSLTGRGYNPAGDFELETSISGLCGLAYDSTIENCYSKASLKIDYLDRMVSVYLSGIARAPYSSSTIKNCYFFGSIVDDSTGDFGVVEPFLGVGSSRVVNSYYPSRYQSPRSYGTPLSDSQFRNIGSFVNWDFEYIWAIESGINDGTPYFLGLVEETGLNLYARKNNSWHRAKKILAKKNGIWHESNVFFAKKNGWKKSK